MPVEEQVFLRKNKFLEILLYSLQLGRVSKTFLQNPSPLPQNTLSLVPYFKNDTEHCIFSNLTSKSGKHITQMSVPPFWGDVGVKKWSPFFNSGAQRPIFGHQSGHIQVPKNRGNC